MAEMIIDKKYRFFQQHEFDLRVPRGYGKVLPLFREGDDLDVVSILQNSLGNDVAKLELGKNDECKLTRVVPSEDGRLVSLLFHRSSPDASTPWFGHRKTGKIRKADHDADEALAVSAHVFIEMVASASSPSRYRAIIEEVPSLGKSYIQLVMNKILRNAPYTYTDENKNDKSTYTLCRFDGYKSENLSDALHNGAVSFIELVKKPVTEGLDPKRFKMKEQTQKVYLGRGESAVMESVRSLKDWAVAREWDEVRVQVRMSEGRSRLVPVGRDDDAAAVLFVRSKQVYVENDLNVCCEEIESQLLGRACELFSENWSTSRTG